MRTIRRPALRLVLLLGLLLPAAGAAATDPGCGAPAELLDAGGVPLASGARAIGEGRLRLLVIGSASVRGPGTSGPAATFPARTEALLRERFPGLAVDLTVHGGRGLTAMEAAAQIAALLPPLRPHLVVWQTGTVEAVRSVEIDLMVEALTLAAEQIHGAGADLMLIDQQFSRFLRANANVDAYREAIRLVATGRGLPLLRRYELMQFWAEADIIDMERAPREQRVAVADRLNACLAEAAAAVIADAIAQARGAPPDRR